MGGNAGVARSANTLTDGGGGGRIVQLTECIDQENVENVSGPACCCRTGTSVESGECDTLRETTMTCSRP